MRNRKRAEVRRRQRECVALIGASHPLYGRNTRSRNPRFLATVLLCALFQAMPGSTAAQFAISIGSTEGEEARGVLPDGSGGAFVVGTFESTTVDFDPGAGTTELTNPDGFADVFLARYDGAGGLVFAVGFGNSQFVGVTAIAPDGSGGVFIAGSFRETLDIDPGPGTTNLISAGWFDIYLARFDGTGNLIFGTRIGNSLIGSTESANDLMEDGSGGVYMTGQFFGTTDFDPGAGTANLTAAGTLGLNDLFLAHYDGAGNYISAFRLGDEGADVGNAMASDGAGGIYLGGLFAGTVDFDPGAGSTTRTSAGSRDAFVARYDMDMNFLSVISFGGVNGESLNDVAADDSGGVFVTGTFLGGADFDPGAGILSHTSQGSTDIFLARYDENGSVVFAHAFGTNGGEIGNCVQSDGAGGVYVAGTFQNTIDFDPGDGTSIVVSNGSTDGLLAHYTGTGGHISAAGIGGTAGEDALCLGYGGPEEIFLVGSYQRTADLDLGPGVNNVTSNGSFDVFLLRLSNVPTPEAESMMNVTESGTVDFGSDVAVCIDFGPVFAAGEVTIERFLAPVQSPEGVDEPVVYESHWRITASPGMNFSSTTVVRIKLDNLPGGSIPDPSNVQFYKRSLYGAGLLVPVTTTYDEATNELRMTGFSSFSEFVAAGEVEVILPVEMSSFRAVVDGADVALSWTTESESNNAGFEVQRQDGEGSWEAMTFVAGQGTTLEPSRYEHTISNLNPGRHRFRLKQIDFDGAFAYSKTVEAVVEVPGTHFLGSAYPNPFNPSSVFTLTVARAQRVRIDLYDAVGRHVTSLFDGEVAPNEAKRLAISGASLPSGLYLYRAVGENFADSRTVMLVR